MKFTKIKRGEDRESNSIVWSNEYSAYKYRDGQDIGTLTCSSYEEVLSLAANGLPNDIAAELRLAGYDLKKIVPRLYQMQERHYQPGDFYDCDLVLEEAVNELPYGVFTMKYSPRHETMFVPYRSNDDKLTLIKNKNLKEDIVAFFNDKSVTGRKKKLNFLLYGPPGNGKTTEIMSLFEICELLKLRIFIIDSDFSIGSLAPAKKILDGQNTVFVLEEITERLTKRGLEEILTFLDGENSWSNSATIATTNNPHEMPANLVDRPGRFEKFVEYGNPTKQEIIELGAAFNYSEEQVSSLFGKDLSFDYVSFILSQSVKLGLPVKETRDKEEQKRKRLSETFKGKIGF